MKAFNTLKELNKDIDLTTPIVLFVTIVAVMALMVYKGIDSENVNQSGRILAPSYDRSVTETHPQA